MEKKNLEKIGEVIKYLTIGAFVVKIGIPLTKELWEEIKKLCRELLRSTSNFQNYYHYQAIPKNTPSPIQKQNIACSSTLKDSGVKTMSQKPEIKTKKAEESPDEIEKETERFLKLIEYIQHPSVILICGWRGEGKSAFGWKLLEIFNMSSAPCYIYRIPERKRKYLPGWVGVIQNFIDLPNDSVLLIDEAALFFHSRDSSLTKSTELSHLVNLSRQRKITLIIVTQQARQIDLNLVSMVDVIFFKDTGELFFERENLKKIVDKARQYFKKVPKEKRKRFVYAFDVKEGKGEFFEVDLPYFWNEKMSTLFDDMIPFSQSKEQKIPSRLLSKEGRNRKIKELKQKNPNLSIRKIAKIFNVSPGTVINALKNYPYKVRRR
ncbi:hypothetical protein J7L87_02705 [bacterium]|nr:hypothetical protein [bacterium]